MSDKPKYLELLDLSIEYLQSQRENFLSDKEFFIRLSDETKLRCVKGLLLNLGGYNIEE